MNKKIVDRTGHRIAAARMAAIMGSRWSAPPEASSCSTKLMNSSASVELKNNICRDLKLQSTGTVLARIGHIPFFDTIKRSVRRSDCQKLGWIRNYVRKLEQFEI